jgi:hypothetical protein
MRNPRRMTDCAHDVSRLARDRSVFRELAGESADCNSGLVRESDEKQTSPLCRPGSGLFSGRLLSIHTRDTAAGKWT